MNQTIQDYAANTSFIRYSGFQTILKKPSRRKYMDVPPISDYELLAARYNLSMYEGSNRAMSDYGMQFDTGSMDRAPKWGGSDMSTDCTCAGDDVSSLFAPS